MTDPLPYSEDEMYWDAVLGEDEPNPDDHCGSCGHDKYDASDFGCQYCDYRIANTAGMSEEEASEYLSQFVMTDAEAAEWLGEFTPDQEEPVCENCGKPFEVMSEAGCAFCDARVRSGDFPPHRGPQL